MSLKISGAQIRAARGFLNWSRDDLKDKAGVSRSTVQAIERAENEPAASETGLDKTHKYRSEKVAESLQKIVTALFKAGVTFLPDDGKGPGVRSKKKRG